MLSRQEIKAKAKELAFKNKWTIWKPLLLIGLIYFVVGFVMGLVGVDPEGTVGSIVSLVLELAILPMSVGYIWYLIKFIKGEKMDVKEALLSKYSIFILILVTTLLVGIFAALWTLLLIIPGIIYVYKVAMVNYILADDLSEGTTWKEVIEKSKAMMDGHKWEFFVFELSFLGWTLLSAVTLGIALIWVVPYMEVATVMYYEELKKLHEAK